MRTVWINLYQQGHYHRVGKPGTLPFHAGDTYLTKEAALADIDGQAPYLGTVPLTVPTWPERGPNFRGLPESYFAPYPADSKPRPLRETRAANWPIARFAVDPTAALGTIETSESEAH